MHKHDAKAVHQGSATLFENTWHVLSTASYRWQTHAQAAVCRAQTQARPAANSPLAAPLLQSGCCCAGACRSWRFLQAEVGRKLLLLQQQLDRWCPGCYCAGCAAAAAAALVYVLGSLASCWARPAKCLWPAGAHASAAQAGQ
jgi:hypothetical protein